MPNYTHEGTPVLAGGDALRVYHSGDTILTLFNPRTGKFDAGKYWNLSLLDAKTEFDHKGFMMFDWHDIVAKNLVINEDYTCFKVDMEQLEKSSRFLSAVIDQHEFGVNEEEVLKFPATKCLFDCGDTTSLLYKNLLITAPHGYAANFEVRKAEEDQASKRIGYGGRTWMEYDPSLKVQAWHEKSMEVVKKVMESYKISVPNIPIRKRGKKED
jgi:hypothetical protein